MYPSDCEIKQGLRERTEAGKQTNEKGYVWRACLPKVKPVKLLLLDVDGVLTDGSITYTDEGSEIKTFHVRDGFGMRQLQKAGVKIGIITARSSKALLRRAQDLSITHIHQGIRNKVEAYEEIRNSLKLEPSEVAFMGDDWIDLPLLKKAGFSAAVADAMPEVKKAVDYVTRMPGGRGAVREVCDLIVEAKGMYDTFLRSYIEP